MNLQDQKEKRPDLETRLTSMENRSKLAEALIDLKGHPGVILLVNELNTDIETINNKLMYSRMSDKERDMLFVQREYCQWLQSRFGHAEAAIVSITKYINNL